MIVVKSRLSADTGRWTRRIGVPASTQHASSISGKLSRTTHNNPITLTRVARRVFQGVWQSVYIRYMKHIRVVCMCIALTAFVTWRANLLCATITPSLVHTIAYQNDIWCQWRIYDADINKNNFAVLFVTDTLVSLLFDFVFVHLSDTWPHTIVGETMAFESNSLKHYSESKSRLLTVVLLYFWYQSSRQNCRV